MGVLGFRVVLQGSGLRDSRVWGYRGEGVSS